MTLEQEPEYCNKTKMIGATELEPGAELRAISGALRKIESAPKPWMFCTKNTLIDVLGKINIPLSIGWP